MAFLRIQTDNLLKKLVIVSVFTVISSLVLLSGEMSRQRRHLIPDNLDAFFLPSGRVMKIATAGYSRMFADLIWIKTLMYFGEEMNGRLRQTWLPAYLDTVIYLDPYFEFAYEWAGAAMIYSGRAIDQDTIKRSIDFYERGIKLFPNNWKMSAGLGFNYAYELHPDDPELKSRNRRLAIKYFLMASKAPGAPLYVKSLAVAQMDAEGFKEAASTFIQKAYASAKSEKERKSIEFRMKKVMGDKDLLQWKIWSEEFNDEWTKSLPFAPPSLFSVLGVRPSLLDKE
ncbi:hypothetical protein KKD49_18285 [Myxococcota bacterium]|nr:hypothetical protein [Myxococcota bacterium]